MCVFFFCTLKIIITYTFKTFSLFQVADAVRNALTLLLRNINVLPQNETVRLDYIDVNGSFVVPGRAGFNASALDCVRWVIKVGKTLTTKLNASFDLGVDGLPLSLSNKGDLTLTLKWGVQFGFGYALSMGGFFVWFPSPDVENVPISDRAAFLSGTAELDVDGVGKLAVLDVKARSYQKSVPPSVQFDVYADIVTREQAAAKPKTTANAVVAPNNATTNSTTTMTMSNSTIANTTALVSAAKGGKTIPFAKLGSMGIVVGWKLSYHLAILLDVSTSFAWSPHFLATIGVKHDVGGSFGSSKKDGGTTGQPALRLLPDSVCFGELGIDLGPLVGVINANTI